MLRPRLQFAEQCFGRLRHQLRAFARAAFEKQQTLADHERHADGAAGPRDGAEGTFASRRDGLIRVAVQLCAAAMAIRRNSFYGPAVQLSSST